MYLSIYLSIYLYRGGTESAPVPRRRGSAATCATSTTS